MTTEPQEVTAAPTEYDRVWRLRKYLPERHGQRCRLVHGSGPGRGPSNVLIEFDDGLRVVTSRFAARRHRAQV